MIESQRLSQNFENQGMIVDYGQGPVATHTPPKFNSSPLKNDGWKTTFLLGRQLFGGYVELREGIFFSHVLNEVTDKFVTTISTGFFSDEMGSSLFGFYRQILCSF